MQGEVDAPAGPATKEGKVELKGQQTTLHPLLHDRLQVEGDCRAFQGEDRQLHQEPVFLADPEESADGQKTARTVVQHCADQSNQTQSLSGFPEKNDSHPDPEGAPEASQRPGAGCESHRLHSEVHVPDLRGPAAANGLAIHAGGDMCAVEAGERQLGLPEPEEGEEVRRGQKIVREFHFSEKNYALSKFIKIALDQKQ